MTQKEFTDRTGYTPQDDEFIQIHEMYMSTDLDKDVGKWRLGKPRGNQSQRLKQDLCSKYQTTNS